MKADRNGLWRHADFLRLWAGTTLVDTGAAVTNLALPLVAIVTLGAGPAQLGVLIALRQAPVPLFGLFAGVWIDRRPRRRLMVTARLGHALLLASLPLSGLPLAGWSPLANWPQRAMTAVPATRLSARLK